MSILAINGGKPFWEPGTYQRAPRSPVDEESAGMMKELYLSGKWSCNSESEQQFENEYAEYLGLHGATFSCSNMSKMEMLPFISEALHKISEHRKEIV